MPSGREYHTPKAYEVPSLDEDVLVQMRAPPDPSEAFVGEEEDSGTENDGPSDPVGAFPGTRRDYGASTSYY